MPLSHDAETVFVMIDACAEAYRKRLDLLKEDRQRHEWIIRGARGMLAAGVWPADVCCERYADCFTDPWGNVEIYAVTRFGRRSGLDTLMAAAAERVRTKTPIGPFFPHPLPI
jgi:hypothetical protein